MNYRDALLLAAEDLDEAGTKVINIDVDQLISEIDIKFKTTKALAYMTAAPPANITKIEIVDGSNVLMSMTGYEVQALAYYNRPGIQLTHGQHLLANSEEDHYPIHFGRYLWDTMLAFDPTRYKNPQLRITFDEDVADTSVSANECEVKARIFDQKQITPIGFLRGQQWHDYSCGNENSYEPIQLPEDYRIRQILVRAFTDGREPWQTIDELRLDENNLQRIPIDETNLENYFRRMKSEWHKIAVPIQGRASSGGAVFYVPVTEYWAAFINSEYSSSHEVYLSPSSLRGGKATLVSASGYSFGAIAMGYLPWHCYQFPMGLPMDIEDWYNPSGNKPRLRLRAGAQGTSGTGQVVLEQFVPY